MCLSSAVGLGLNIAGSIMGQASAEKQATAQQQAVLAQAQNYTKAMIS